MVTPPTPGELEPTLRALETAYPNEGCGVLLRRRDGTWHCRPMVNAYDRYHAKDPVRFPRTSRTAYFFEPREWMEVFEQVEADGGTVACIFHSHADVGAYFSEEDRNMAAPEGQPLLPGTAYLVVAVNQGRATAAKLFWWNEGHFDERPVSLPTR